MPCTSMVDEPSVRTMSEKRDELVSRLQIAQAALSRAADDARRLGFGTEAVSRLVVASDALYSAAGAIAHQCGCLAKMVEAADLAHKRLGYIGGAPGVYRITEKDWSLAKNEAIATSSSVMSYANPSAHPGEPNFVGTVYGSHVYIDAGPSRYVIDDGDRGTAVAWLDECLGHVFGKSA